VRKDHLGRSSERNDWSSTIYRSARDLQKAVVTFPNRREGATRQSQNQRTGLMELCLDTDTPSHCQGKSVQIVVRKCTGRIRLSAAPFQPVGHASSLTRLISPQRPDLLKSEPTSALYMNGFSRDLLPIHNEVTRQGATSAQTRYCNRAGIPVALPEECRGPRMSYVPSIVSRINCIRFLALSRSNATKRQNLEIVNLSALTLDLTRTKILLSCSGTPVRMCDTFPVFRLEATSMNSYIPGKSPFSFLPAATFRTPGFLDCTPRVCLHLKFPRHAQTFV
jgi:hypothetical protein